MAMTRKYLEVLRLQLLKLGRLVPLAFPQLPLTVLIHQFLQLVHGADVGEASLLLQLRLHDARL